MLLLHGQGSLLFAGFAQPRSEVMLAMTVKCRFFASLREKVGAKEKELMLPEGTKVTDVLTRVGLKGDGAYILLRNGVHAEKDEVLKDGDVLSVFPLIAGG